MSGWLSIWGGMSPCAWRDYTKVSYTCAEIEIVTQRFGDGCRDAKAGDSVILKLVNRNLFLKVVSQ